MTELRDKTDLGHQCSNVCFLECRDFGATFLEGDGDTYANSSKMDSVSKCYDRGILENTIFTLLVVLVCIHDELCGGSSNLPSRRPGRYDPDR